MPGNVRRFSRIVTGISAIVICASLATPAHAAHHKKTHKKKSGHAHAAQATDGRFSALVVDADSGRVLYEKNAGAIRYPASLTKMMTLYLTFDALKHGSLRLDQSIAVSAKAAAQPQTNIALAKGSALPMRTAIESVVVRSANDSAEALGEALGGTDFNFALMMTNKARQLGMKDTIFRNPNGLPDDKQHTTAYDMAKLGIALRRDFPEYYPFFKLTSFTYNGVTYPGHNHVMARYAGVDGIKTGFIRASGYNLVTSAHRGGHNLVGVVLGGATINGRDDAMIAMLDRSFAQLESQRKAAVNQVITPKKDATIQAANAVAPHPNTLPVTPVSAKSF